jgi:phospholipase/carboxylesterase
LGSQRFGRLPARRTDFDYVASMRKERLGELSARLTGGVDGLGSGDGPVVVLLHGFGAPGDDLVGLERMFRVPKGVRYVFPEAPLSLAPHGYGPGRAWWMIDLDALERRSRGERVDRSDEQPPGLAEARAALAECLNEIESKLSVTRDRMILGGFSQGAMLSLDAVLHGDKRPAGLIQMSGTLIALSQWQPRFERCRGLPIFQSHGMQDTLLPYRDATQLRDLLIAAGAELTFVDFAGGHEIPEPVLAGVSQFVTARLAQD